MKQFSEWSKKVSGHYPREAFEIINTNCHPKRDDLYAFVRTYILEGIPFAFESCPFVYDEIRYRIASELRLNHNDINLTGSAKLGFSLSPDKWLNEYNPEISDLDFYIISEKLFENLNNDYIEWRNRYKNADDKPNTNREQEIWDDNIKIISKTISNGFINPRLLSTKYIWPSRCESICIKLPKIIKTYLEPFKLTTTNHRGSLRVYRDRISAVNRICFNINDAISIRLGFPLIKSTLTTSLGLDIALK